MKGLILSSALSKKNRWRVLSAAVSLLGCEQSKEVAVKETKAAAPAESALIATRTVGPKGEVPGLGIDGEWLRLNWENGFEVVVATSEDQPEKGVWYQLATFQHGKLINLHEKVLDALNDIEEGKIESCDSLAPVAYALDGPVIGLGVSCYRRGEDNNSMADYVQLFQVKGPPNSIEDLKPLLGVKLGSKSIGHYENKEIATTLELRGPEVWRKDVITEGVTQEEELEGVEREPVTQTKSEKLISL